MRNLHVQDKSPEELAELVNLLTKEEKVELLRLMIEDTTLMQDGCRIPVDRSIILLNNLGWFTWAVSLNKSREIRRLQFYLDHDLTWPDKDPQSECDNPLCTMSHPSVTIAESEVITPDPEDTLIEEHTRAHRAVNLADLYRSGRKAGVLAPVSNAYA